MATKAVKKSPFLGAKQKIDNKMALGIIAAVLGVCAVVYYLATNAATASPIVYYTGTYDSTTYKVTGAINAVSIGGTANSTLAGPSTNNYYSDPSYSSNHKLIAWGGGVNGGPDHGALQIYDVSAKTTKNIDLPDKEYVSGPVAWYPNSTKVVFFSSNAQNQYILRSYTLKTGALTEITKLPSSQVAGLTVTGDNKNIVFVQSDGAVKLVKGSTVTTISPAVANLYCAYTSARPQSTLDIAYTCNSYDGEGNVSSSVYLQTIGSPAKVIYNSVGKNKAGSTYDIYDEVTWSADGAKLGIRYTTYAYKASCKISSTRKIGTGDVNGGAILSLVKFKTTTQGCKGGISYSKSVAFSPDGSLLTFVEAGALQYIATTGKDTPHTLVKTDVSGISW